jgi:hypothetical protein
MKLLNCTKCHDVVAVKSATATLCQCRASQAQYLRDGLNVLLLGEHARVLGMLNREYRTSLSAPIVPFETNYRWFPILPQPEHHVHKVASTEEFQRRLAADRPPRHRAKCLVCNTVVESLDRHDYVSCTCGQLSVDGGGGHPMERRILYQDKSKYELVADGDD